MPFVLSIAASRWVVLLPLLASVMSQGCQTRKHQSKRSAVAKENEIAVESSYGKVKFGFSKKSAGLRLDGPATGSEELSNIIIEIKDASENTVERNLPLLKFGETYATAPIDLPIGDYTLEKFSVLEGDRVIYATPLSGSPRANLVSQPLPLVISVFKDGVSTVIPEVIDVFDAVAADFGYSNFQFSVVQGFDFLVSVGAFNPDTNAVELVPAHIMVTGEIQPYYYEGELEAITNQVKINDVADNVTITVSREGYGSDSKSMSTEELRTYFDGRVLTFMLAADPQEPASTATIRFTADGFDLETAEIINVLDFRTRFSPNYDVVFAYNSTTTSHSRLSWNATYADVAFVDVPFEDVFGVDDVVFCKYASDPSPDCRSQTPDAPFTSLRTGIVRTGANNYYKVGFVSESDDDQTVTFQYQQLPAPCGDGMRQNWEACDDGNWVPEDGCSETCDLVEQGFTCPPEGGACTLDEQ